MKNNFYNELRGIIEDVNMNEILSHIQDGTLNSWINSWKNTAIKVIEDLKPVKQVRIIIAGTREFEDYEFLKENVHDVIFKLECKNLQTGIGNLSRNEERDKVKIISGTARGADKLGEKYAEEYGYEVIRFPADWDNLGKRAGYIRNEQMAKYASEGENYGVLIAFWDGESRGTKHMIDLANKHRLDVYVINYKNREE